MNKKDKMNEIIREVEGLKTSPLYEYRVSNGYVPVVGEGSLDAEIMFIGEAPGENEAKTGKPFCGRSGKLLDEFLSSVGLPREIVYITSVVKDRPPKNRDPLPSEIEIYAPYLDRQIDIIMPKVIVTLGRFSMNYIMERYCLKEDILPISKAHGKMFEALMSYGKVNIVPLYHPAVAIYNSNTKSELLKDFMLLKKFTK